MARVRGVSRPTVSRWLRARIRTVSPRRRTVKRAQADEGLEVDEAWSFVGPKRQKRWRGRGRNRRTRQRVACPSGERRAARGRKLWHRLPAEERTCHADSDFWPAYAPLLTTGTPQLVAKETGQTAHAERGIGTLRQRRARYVRKSRSFSKTDTCHQLVTKWFIHDHNLSLTM